MSDRSSGKTAATQSNAALSLAEGESGSAPEGGDRMARLIRTIEGEIVPRLLVSFSGSLTTAGDGPDLQAIDELARLLLVHEDVRAADILRRIYPAFKPSARTCLGLIAPTARRLGELWERDECDVDQLLVGLSRLESVILELHEGASGSGH